MLTAKDLKQLRQKGHQLKPVVLVGKEGLSPKVLDAVDAALTTHELIKVKLLQSCSIDKNEAAQLLSEGTNSVMVQRIGKTTLLYRPIPEKEDED